MKIWMVWLQSDDMTWIEAAWTDEMMAENYSGWQEEVKRCRKLAFENDYELRIQLVSIPGVYQMFDFPKATAILKQEER